MVKSLATGGRLPAEMTLSIFRTRQPIAVHSVAIMLYFFDLLYFFAFHLNSCGKMSK